MRCFRMLALAALLCIGGDLIAQRIDGRVTDARTGMPLPSAHIVLSPGGAGTAADASGAFSLRDVPSGTVTVRVTHVGYEPWSSEIRVEAGTFRLDVALTQTAMPGPVIEVLGTRGRERETPATFSEIRLGELREEYFVQDVPVLLSDLPSSTFYSESGHGIGYNYLRIRGFDQRRLAVMVNGVPQNDPEDHNVYWINFIDLLGSTDEIQVQRGAGSAFYGPPAIGGSINLVTGDFANQKGARLSLGYGSYVTRRASLALGSGLVDDRYVFFGRLTRLQSAGYREHSYVDAATYYVAATRYDEAVTTRINLYGGPVEDGLVYTGLPKFAVKDRSERRRNYNYWEEADGAYTYTQRRRPQEREQFSQPHVELLNEWRVSDRVTITSALFHFTGSGYFDYDGTGYTDAAYYRLTPEYGFDGAGDPLNPIIRAQVDNRQWGWLPRVTVRHDGGELNAGVELRRHRSLHWGRIQWAEGLPEGLDPDRRYYEYSGMKLIGSAYAYEAWRPTERLTVLGGAMLVFNRYRLYDEMYVGTDFTKDYLFVNPRFGVNYNLDARWNLYGNISYTQREPRLKNLYDAAESSGGAVPQFERRDDGRIDVDRPFVDPERLVNIELGAGFRSTTVTALANAYVMDFADEIVKSGRLDRFGQPVTGNADRTLHLGIEAELRWRPIPELEIDLNGLVSRSRLQSYTVYDDDGSARSLDGNRIAGFPELLGNARLTWRHGGLWLSMAVKHVGAQYTDNEQNELHKVDPYTVLNATAGYRIPAVLGLRGLDLRLTVNNLLDHLYAQSGEGNQFFVGAERNAFFDLAFEL